MNLPTPPPDYWTHVPWQGFLGLCAFALLLYSPYGVQWLRGRAGHQNSRDEAFARAQDRLEVHREDYLAEVKASEQAARRALERERASGLRWFAVARGWEELAHRMRHAANGHLTTANLRLQAQGLLPVATELPPLPELEAVEGAVDDARQAH